MALELTRQLPIRAPPVQQPSAFGGVFAGDSSQLGSSVSVKIEAPTIIKEAKATENFL